MGNNKVLESTKPLVENPKHVFIDKDKLEYVARRFSQEDLQIPSWEEPVFLDKWGIEWIDLFMIGNALNFAFVDFKTKQKFSTVYNCVEWKGAFGMWACLKRAFEEGVPITNDKYLANISREDAENIFQGNITIPLFEERVRILRELGCVLDEKYCGYFHNFFMRHWNRLFNDGEGFVERLVQDFPSFDDSVKHEGRTVRFDKRAQLSAAMIYGRLISYQRNLKRDEFKIFDDVGELTVFADYGLPKSLRDLGIFSYEPFLAERVDQQVIIPAGSREELEIRASTIHASKMLTDKINELRGKNDINALHIDYKLWSESRSKKGNHHLTITTAY